VNDQARRRVTPVAEALASWLARSGFGRRLEQASVVAEWPALVGPQIAAVTQPESVTPDGVLRVRVATAPWAAELGLMTPRILARVNAGRRARITEIRWMAGRDGRPLTP
jgi:predicted nucleic acid-binding Zn ribbon protein